MAKPKAKRVKKNKEKKVKVKNQTTKKKNDDINDIDEELDAQADVLADMLINTEFIRENANRKSITEEEFNILSEHVINLHNMAAIYELLLTDKLAVDIDEKGEIVLIELPEGYHESICPSCKNNGELKLEDAEEEYKNLDKTKIN